MGRVLGGEILGARKAGVLGDGWKMGGVDLMEGVGYSLLWVLGFGGSFSQGEPAGAECSLNSWSCCVGQSVSGLDNYIPGPTKSRSRIGKL